MNKINLYSLKKEDFKKIADKLNNDPDVNKFVRFYDYETAVGIFYNNQLVGLFSLNRFINNSLAIHIAILKEFRNKGIGSKVLNKIVEDYGITYSEVEFFTVNINYKNKTAIDFVNKLGWNNTHKYDEIMDNEGSEFFIIYEKGNPYYHRKVKSYDTK